MNESVALLAVVAHVAVCIALVHSLTRRVRIEITNEFSEADTEVDDDADSWKPDGWTPERN